MNYFDLLIERIRSLGEEITFSGPQTPESIALLENALEVNLPPSYRRFLSVYGAGGTKGDWIAGIYNNDPLRSNDGYAFGETLRMRQNYQLPLGLVVIQSSPPEIVWCLDVRNLESGQEAPVVAIDVLKNFRSEKIADNFDAYFREYLEVRAED